MITFEEALKIAEENKYGDKLAFIEEFSDRYVFDYVSAEGYGYIVSGPLSVMKETGETGRFFPPHYDDDYKKSGIVIFGEKDDDEE